MPNGKIGTHLILMKNISLFLLLFLLGSNIYAQDNKSKSADEIAKELSNPVGTLANPIWRNCLFQNFPRMFLTMGQSSPDTFKIL